MGEKKAQGEFGIILIAKLSGNFIATTKTTGLKRWEEKSLSFVEGKEAGKKGHFIQDLRIALY